MSAPDVPDTTDETTAAPGTPAHAHAERILIVDDEHEIADLVATYLEASGYEALVAYDPKEAWSIVQHEHLDLAIIDVMLPGMSGFELCKRIRREHLFPIIMLTAKVEEEDRIEGLSSGADDYVTKPFLPLELVARVKAQLRRSTKYNRSEIDNRERYEVGGVSIDLRTRECTFNERPLSLTPTEFDILRILCENRGKAVSAKELYRQIWGDSSYDSSSGSVAVHVRHLREKLGDSFEKPKYIKTVWGCGYKID